MQLDTYTLQLTTSLMVLGSLIVMGALRFSQQEKGPVNYWLASFFLAGPGFLALAFRPQLPDYSETIGNTAIIIGLLLLNRGLRMFVGVLQRPGIEAVFLLAHALPFLTFTYFWPSYPMRTTIVNFVLVAICLDIVYTLYRRADTSYRTAALSVGAVFGLLAVALTLNQVDVFANFSGYSPQDVGPLFLMITFIMGGLTMTLTFLSYAKLSAEYRLFANAVNQSSNSILITDPKGRITYANKGFQDKTGKALSSLLREDEPHKFGDMGELDYKRLWETVRSGKTWRGEVQTQLGEGTSRWEVTTISPIRLHNERVSHLVAIQEDISALKEAEARIRHLAYHDALTGLPSLRLAEDRFEAACLAAKRGNRNVAVLFLDLDGFKLVNDTHGHDGGDQLLVAIASRMAAAVRESDTVARIGGDEFLAVLSQADSQGQVEQVAGRIIDNVAQPFELRNGNSVNVGCSIGIAFYPVHGSSLDSVLKSADKAMYRVKRSGKNSYRVAA